jgi:hypothetical protein
MKLIHRNDLTQYRPLAYSSREALPWVEKALEGLHDIEGLQGLRDALLLNFDSEILNAVESDVIESFLTEGSTAVGIGATMFAQHLKTIADTLKDLEKLHQRTYQQHGHLQTAEFFAERKRLLSQLDNSLGPLVRKSIGLPDHPKLKTALGISSRSLIHHWEKAGAPGQIPGYATHIDGVSKAAKYVKAGGAVAIDLSATASAIKVQETCR